MLKLSVPSMTCGHCGATVRKAVQGVDPGAAVEVDLGARTVGVETAADQTAIIAAIGAAGYEAQPAA